MKMDRPNRKRNRLDRFDYGEVGCYFVTLCTQNRASLFTIEPSVGNDLCVVPNEGLEGTAHRPFPATEQNQILHKWIRETQNKYKGINIDKYVIMPDHLHLIVTIKEQHAACSLPEVMQFFKTMTTNEYIRGVKKGTLLPFQGKLWQKSYYDHVIRNQQDYNEIWEYIEQNPIKWLETHSTP